MNTIECTPGQLKAVLHSCYKSKNKKVVPFIQGPPGVGKSSGVDEFAREIEAHNEDCRLSYYGPQDFGYPYLEEQTNGTKRMRFSEPAFWPKAGRKTVIKFEEVNTASQSVFKCCQQLTLDRKINDHVLPEDTFIVLLGNRPEDRCGVEKIGAALMDRVTIIKVRVDLNEWIHWAQKNDIDPLIIAYIKFAPQNLSTFDGAKWDGVSNFATPRSWEKASEIIKHATDRHVRHALLEGTLGQGITVEFNAFLDVYEKLPNFDEVLKNPTTALVPQDPSTVYATCAGLSKKVKPSTVGAFLTYTERMGREFAIFALKTALNFNKQLAATPAFVTWAAANPEVFA